MCNAQAAMMGVSAAGNMMQNRAQHKTQMDHVGAQTQAMQATNQRQLMLREMERQRQEEFNRRQQQGFAQSLAAAQPQRIREAEAGEQDTRMRTAQAVRDQTSADVPLPGGTIPGSSGLSAQATRTVGQNLERGGNQQAAATAALQGLPAALGGLGELFAPGATQIGLAGTASQRSRGLLPDELDAARIAPRIPAPRSSVLGAMLSGLGGMGSQWAGVRQGQQEAQAAAQRAQQEQQNEILRQLFGMGLSNAPFRPGAPPLGG